MIDWLRLSRSMPSRANTWTSITVPLMPEGTRRLVSLTSEAFSPKMARSSFSSGVSRVSPFGLTLPARVGGGRDGSHNALGEASALINDGPVVDVGVLVATRVLGDLINVGPDVARHRLLVVHAHLDAVGVDIVDHAAAQRDDAGAR